MGGLKGGGGMVEFFFSGISILSNELGVIGRVSTNMNILKVVLGPCAHVATGGKKWLKIPKYKRKEIELRSFHHSTPLDELIFIYM